MHSRPRRLAQARVKDNKKLNRVLVCGVSYKPNVSDTRDAPQSAFVQELKQNNVMVDFYDPLVDAFEGLEKVPDLSNVKSYDRVFVMHKHDTCRENLEELRGLPNVEFFE
jgi:UDP-N-acetyl-D-mannosaminuronate dehydrogenase